MSDVGSSYWFFHPGQWKTDSIKEMRLAADHAGKALPQIPLHRLVTARATFYLCPCS